MIQKFVCDITGAVDAGVDSTDFKGALGPLGTAPLGWTRVVAERRVPNPQWAAIMSVKESQLSAYEVQLRQAGLSEDVISVQYAVMSLASDATFHAMEKDTPPFLTITETLWLAPEADALEVWNEARELLNLPAIDADTWQLLADEEEPDAGSTPNARGEEQV